MNWIGLAVLLVSSVLLLYIWISRRLGVAWLTKLGLQIVLAAVAIYAVNYAGFFGSFHIPMNPVTISTVLVLGLPGVGLLISLKLTGI
ncbi:pro-sigmaK processing inhibitor BofA [Paenibacillus sp. CAA11]|uniref:pro-sigmaK processing inhibitor BofA family protein n=1 Tax=Paenibacillus sp. CAA11 TaxID=1532905 RepID=UPI000D34C98F|nr:pro-sigmaK processing inhibitor BofA family protein [Paenibacillus sp. CAA11]AWB42897.1 pro-sigmaK processing inhibitor BofA [Paenibacillus sp. CAA11]